MIHQYKSNGYNIVMDVNSGAVHVVDDTAYDVISLYESSSRDGLIDALSPVHGKERVREALSEVESLKDAGQLFSDDPYAPYARNFADRQSVVKALCLHVAHDCNLACRYCFAQEGEYHGKRELMTFETGRAALDFLVANSGDRVNLEVDFFGGEPLMDWDVVKQLVQYGRLVEKEKHKNFRFTLTTNGVLLNDEISEFLNREMSNVVLSLDGRRDVNDRMRPFRSGRGSYDTLVPKFKKFADSRHQENYYIRGTFTRENLDFSKDVEHLADLGFKRISVEPVVAPADAPYSIREEDVPAILDEYDRLCELYLKREKEGRGFLFFHFMIDLEQGPCVIKRMSGCGSGTEYLAVTPSGDLYPCHQFAGEPEFLMGNVRDGITRGDIAERFRHLNVYEKEECKNCFAKFYCSGGCAANAYHEGGAVDACYGIGCALQRKRVECALMIKAALSGEN